MTSRPSAVHARFAVLAVVVVAVYLADVPVLRAVAMVASSAAVTARVAYLLVRGRLPSPRPWWFVVGGVGLLTVNNVVWFVQVDLGGAQTASGLITVLALPLGYVGMLLASILIITPIARRDSGGVLDAALIAIGAAIVLWTLWLFPALERAGAGVAERSYDLLVILLVAGIAGAIVRAIVSAREARGTLTYLLIAVLCTLAGNAFKIVVHDPVTGTTPTWLGILWVLGYIALASAAAHPSSAHLSTSGRPWEGRLTTQRLVYLGMALGVNPVIGAVRELTGREVDWLLLTIGSLVVVPLVLLRVSQLARLHADAERRLAHLANHDPLTGLPNRRAVDRHLEAVLGRVHRHQAEGAAVLFLDLDDFKKVNDTLGHRVGDDLLAAVALRLQRCIRSTAGDVVARFGGDEFVMVLEGDPDRMATDAARRVEAALSAPVVVGDHVLPAGGSVGVVAVHPGDGSTVDQLLSAADARMYERKRERRAARA